MSTLAMAILEQCGICDMVDERIEPDPQRIPTPGKAVKLKVGAIFMGMGRRPLYLFDRLYASAPLELLCGGESVVPKNFNARAFSRALDDIFSLDLPALTFDIYSRLAERYLIAGFVYHIDSTNFGVIAVVIDRDDPEAAIPEWNGHAKDGDNSKRVYNLQTVTDSSGSSATMTAGIINAAMRRQGRLKTAEGMIDDLAMTIVKHDRLMGDEISTKEFRQYIQVMGLDKDNLFSN